MKQENKQYEDGQNLDLIRMNEVCVLSTLKPATIWKAMRNKTIPAPIKLMGRINCWKRSEIISWLESMRAEK